MHVDLLLLTYAARNPLHLRRGRCGYKTQSHVSPAAWVGSGYYRHHVTLCGKKWYETERELGCEEGGRAVKLGDQQPTCKRCLRALAKMRQAQPEPPAGPVTPPALVCVETMPDGSAPVRLSFAVKVF